MKICIVGGVAGGASAAARLRRLDEKVEIVMFERGKYISFANCGLPYHISGKIKERSSLLILTPESFETRFNVDVRVNNEVLSIDKQEKTIQVRDLKKNKNYNETYDKLILAPGAGPFVPPIKGVDSDMFMNLRNIPDLDRIISHIKENNVKRAVVIGGGFVGVEIAENLSELGIKTSLVELLDQVLLPLDKEMANIVHHKLQERGIQLYLSNGVKEISNQGVVLNSGKEIEAGIVIGAIGVRPETGLAKEAGLKLGKTGGIIVDGHMRTSDPDIYAAGDAIEVTHFVTGSYELIPLAGPANKQGRIAADNICGMPSVYKGTQGTGILKVFNLQVAFTGINEKQARKTGINYKTIHLHPDNHANYYPDSHQISLKVLFDIDSGKIYGAQGIGPDGVDKRIDVFATAIRAGMTVFDLEELELAYAPPFGSAKDPVNMAGYIGANIIKEIFKSITYDEIKNIKNPLLVDVRTTIEFKLGNIPDSVNIPVDELRSRINELPKDRNIVICCQVGIRAYIAYRFLIQAGFKDICNLSGGYKTYLNYTYKLENMLNFNQDSNYMEDEGRV